HARALAAGLAERGFRIVSGGTDTHLFLLSLVDRDVTGKAAQVSLERAGITTNKNMVPFDPRKPAVTSGLRIGTPAVTTRGLREAEMREIAGLVARALERHGDVATLDAIRGEVEALCRRFPLYPGRWGAGGEPAAGGSVRCPCCSDEGNRVIDSRLGRAGAEIRRRRECIECGRRFTTRERVEEILPKVCKRDERREDYDRDKLVAGIQK